MLDKKWKPSKEQQQKWQKIFFENKHIPLTLITTTQAKGKLDESEGMIFVNRDLEKNNIKNVLQNIAQTGQTLAVRLSGAGGVGKTHFIRYLQYIIKTKTVKMDLDLDSDFKDIHFDCCIMDAPKHADFLNFYNLYTQTWEGFGKENFFDEFSTLIFIKILKIFNEIASKELDETLNNILGKDWRYWKDLNYLKVKDRLANLKTEKFLEFKTILSDNFNNIFKVIRADFPNSDLRNIFFDILSLLDILIPDLIKSTEAIKSWQLNDLKEDLSFPQQDELAIKKLKELIEIYSWLYPKYVWILAIDDLSHLEDSDIQKKFFDLLKIFRNQTHNFCIILTATIDQWTYFDDSLKGSDKEKQLQGIFPSDLCYFDLDYLPDQEMMNWLGRVIQNWWNKFNIKLPPDGQWYPFSREAMEFIINYDANDKTPRSVGNRLLDLWNNITNSLLISGKLFIDSEFEAWKLMPHTNYTKINPFIQKLLLSYRIKEEYGKFSGAIEDGLKKILEILRQSQEFRLIDIVDIRRNFECYNENFKSKSKKRRADVLIILQEPGGAEKVNIEFQVKAGDPNREIKDDELESSFDLLENNITDFLIVLSFSDLSLNAKKKLEQFEGRYNITAIRLPPEQRAYCVLVAYFDEITGRKLTPIESADIFSKIFGESPNRFFRLWLERKKSLIEKEIGKKKEEKGEEEEEKEREEEEKGDIDVLNAMKWIVKTGIERTGAYKNRVTKTWLLNRKDCPDNKDIFLKAWQELIKSEKYGKLEKTSFIIDIKSAELLVKNTLLKYT